MKRGLLLVTAEPTSQSGLFPALTTDPLSLFLSHSHISIYMPITDQDTNKFSPFISPPCFSSCYILLSINKTLKRHTISVHPSQRCFRQALFFHEGCQLRQTHKLNLCWRSSQLQSKQNIKLNNFQPASKQSKSVGSRRTMHFRCWRLPPVLQL